MLDNPRCGTTQCFLQKYRHVDCNSYSLVFFQGGLAGVIERELSDVDEEDGDHDDAKDPSGKGDKKSSSSAAGRWSNEEDEELRRIVQIHGPKNWKKV